MIPLSGEIYTPQAVAACEKALRTILARVGPWGSRVVLVGGMAPRYLVRTPPAHIPPHPGTTDLDIVVGITVDDDPACYRTLQKNLLDTGFAPSRDEEGGTVSFRWERRVDGVLVQLEFLCPLEEGGQAGRLRRNPGPGVGSQISAIRIPGAHLVSRDHLELLLDGELLDGAGIREGVTLRVTNVAPFLMLKGLAIRDRVKEKDPFDVVWLLLAHPEGPDGVALAVRQSPIADEPEMLAAIAALDRAFAEPNRDGPSGYAITMLGLAHRRAEEHVEEAARFRRDAHGAVQRFLSRLKEGDRGT